MQQMPPTNYGPGFKHGLLRSIDFWVVGCRQPASNRCALIRSSRHGKNPQYGVQMHAGCVICWPIATLSYQPMGCQQSSAHLRTMPSSAATGLAAMRDAKASAPTFCNALLTFCCRRSAAETTVHRFSGQNGHGRTNRYTYNSPVDKGGCGEPDEDAEASTRWTGHLASPCWGLAWALVFL